MKSERGQGATFILRLPIVAKSVHANSNAETGILEKEVERLRLQRRELLGHIEAIAKSKDVPSKAQNISLSELQHLVSNIAYDLQDGFNIIRNTTSFLLDEASSNSSLTADLCKIAYSAEFCWVVTQNLMALGGRGTVNPTEINIEVVAREVFLC